MDSGLQNGVKKPNGLSNRPHLNFGTNNGFNTDQSYQASNDHVYPTTPSTFPQPVFQNQPGQVPRDYLGSQIQSPTASGYSNGGGYFPNNQFQPQYTQQQQNQYPSQYQQQGLQSPQPSYSQRQGGYNTNDPTTGLAHQFSNQNLGISQRQGSPFGRQPSPNQLFRQVSASQQSYGTHLTPTMSSTSSSSQVVLSEDPPEKNAEKYSANVVKRGTGLHVFVESFFRDNIDRARERNYRAKQLENFCSNPQNSDQSKKNEIDETWRSEVSYLRLLRTKESSRNFTTLKIIGKGAFGEVKLVQRKADNQIYALKCLVKTEMFKKDQLAHVRAERDILAQSDSPWVVKLHTTFQDSTFLYMLMDFLPGGDLMTMLIKYEIFSEDITRFYMAEILLAIEAVHKLGFIHRDIKPDNILLDKGGHIKLTDFGLSTGFHKQHEGSYYQKLLKTTSSKTRDNRNSISLDQINLTVSNRGQIQTWRKSRRVMAYSTVGTPDYIAPEIFSRQGYSFSCDWWSVGAIMFECLIGWPPFCAEDPHDTYRKIVDWRNTLYFPEDIPLAAQSEHLIRSLLCDSANRLGSDGAAHGASEIKRHPFFRGVVWDRLRGVRAPFEPKLSSKVDVSYFPVNDIDQEDHTEQWKALGEEHDDEMGLPFIGYTYKRFQNFKGY